MMLKSNVKPKLGGEVYTVRCMIQETSDVLVYFRITWYKSTEE